MVKKCNGFYYEFVNQLKPFIFIPLTWLKQMNEK